MGEERKFGRLRPPGRRALLASFLSMAALTVALLSCATSGNSPLPDDASTRAADAAAMGALDDATDETEPDGAPMLSLPESGPRCKSCQDFGWTCGINSDSCGNIVNCGSCVPPETCGGGGFSKCGIAAGGEGGPCVPTTCQNLGYDCGPAGDGCGGLLQCGTCSSSDVCGGGGPGRCGAPCSNLCRQQVACDGGGTTIVSGRVVAGTLSTYGSPDPVPDVLVYVPNAPLRPFAPGVQCSRCGAEVSGVPLISTRTNFDGTFSLTNVPAGNAIPIVIQLGRWRRQVTFSVPGCATTAVGDIHMPRSKAEGDIPLTAISTGSLDAIECVLLKMGVDASEFTPDTGVGRIHLFSGYDPDAGFNGSGVTAGPGTRTETALTGGNGQVLFLYDQVLFPCWGSNYPKEPADLANLVFFANQGGRVFATHYSYSWLYQNPPFDQTASWDVDHSAGSTISGNVNVASNPRGPLFVNWLRLVGALSQANPPQVTINSPRHDVDSIRVGSVDWIDGTDPSDSTAQLLHYTFDTPWGAPGPSQCGHVIYSDFHVTENQTSPSVTFPEECSTTAMTPQEKILEYMIWDLQSCVGPPPTSCSPRTCVQQSIGCGPAGDGCGRLIQCGSCPPPSTCGGGGSLGQCGYREGGSCAPQTCAQQGISCGPAGDGCGNAIDCGSCALPMTCGGGGTPGQCGGAQ